MIYRIDLQLFAQGPGVRTGPKRRPPKKGARQ